MVELRTDRLFLREFVVDDFEETHVHTACHQVVKYVDWGLSSEEETRQFLKRRIQEQNSEPRLKYKLALTMKDKIFSHCGITITSLTHDKEQ